MYLPARETTCVVGPSGCSKSTIGALLLGQYAPPNEGNGNLLLDEQGIRYLNLTWIRCHVASVVQGSAGQGAQVFRGSAHWNVALGVVRSGRRVEDVSREEVCEACRIATLEGWVNGLDTGYENVLAGSGGAEEQDGGVTVSRECANDSHLSVPESMIPKFSFSTNQCPRSIQQLAFSQLLPFSPNHDRDHAL